jgi:hypothetical protein
MLGILYARSPQLSAGAVPGPVSQLSVAPTVCDLLGIEPAPAMRSPTLMDLPR